MTAAVAASGRPARRRLGASRRGLQPSKPPAPLVFLLLLLASVAALAAAAPAVELEAENPELEEDSINEILPREFLMKRAQNLGQRMCQVDIRNCPSLGKKFGRYSWLRSADSTRRRLEFYLANKWQREALQRQMKRQIPILPIDVNWRPIIN